MRCVSYTTISLPDILIMAHMNVVQATRYEGPYLAEFTWIMETTTI